MGRLNFVVSVKNGARTAECIQLIFRMRAIFGEEYVVLKWVQVPQK